MELPVGCSIEGNRGGREAKEREEGEKQRRREGRGRETEEREEDKNGKRWSKEPLAGLLKMTFEAFKNRNSLRLTKLPRLTTSFSSVYRQLDVTSSCEFWSIPVCGLGEHLSAFLFMCQTSTMIGQTYCRISICRSRFPLSSEKSLIIASSLHIQTVIHK